MTAQNIQDDLSAPDTLELRAKLFRGLSDPSRLTILDALVSDERNVQEIVGHTGLGQPTSRTICAVCWNAGWSVAAAKAASFGIVWRTGGSPISSVMQISYLPRQPTELMPAKAIRTNRRDLLQCPIGAPNLKQPSAHPQRMHPLSRIV
jgi:hypothetical protein